jgi:opacity protein-like surface antigen
MKNSSFENNLKSLSQDFVVDVNQQQFNRVMELRAQKYNRKKLFWWFGSVSAVVLCGLFLTLIAKLNQTELNQTASKQEVSKQNRLYNHQKNKSTAIFKESNIFNTTSTQNKKNTAKHQHNHTIKNNSKSSAKFKYQKNSLGNDNILTHQTTKNNGLIVTKSHQIINEELIYTLTNKPELIKPRAHSTTLAPNKNMILPLVSSSKEIEEQKTGLTFIKGVYFNAAYFPFLSAKNASSMLPDKKASMVGLSEDANFAHAANFGAVFNLSKSLQLLAGVGIHTIRFDKIREVTVSVDTMFESLTSNATKLNFEHVADFSFTWFDVPVVLRHNKPINNKFNWYVQAGLSYRYLIQNKSYTFQVDSNQLKTYELRTNHANSRINKHQITILVEPGMAYNLTRNITVNLGVPFQQELFSVYNKEYADRAAFKLLGLKAGVQYNF